MNKLFACLWDGEGLPAYSKGKYDVSHVRSVFRTFGPVNLHLFTDMRHATSIGLQISNTCMDIGGQLDMHPLSDSMLAIGGWAPNLSVFSPAHWPEEGERCVWVGLDTVAVGDTSWLWEWDEAPIGLPREPYRPATVCNAVTTWNREGAELVWNAAQTNPSEWIYAQVPSEMILLRKLWLSHGWPTLDDMHPGSMCSYKAHIKRSGATKPPENCSIVYFHGNPKPQDLEPDDWVYKAWAR